MNATISLCWITNSTHWTTACHAGGRLESKALLASDELIEALLVGLCVALGA